MVKPAFAADAPGCITKMFSELSQELPADSQVNSHNQFIRNR